MLKKLFFVPLWSDILFDVGLKWIQHTDIPRETHTEKWHKKHENMSINVHKHTDEYIITYHLHCEAKQTNREICIPL